AAARQLSPAGAFIIEAEVPDPAQYERGQYVRASVVRTDTDWAGLDLAIHDPVAQRTFHQHLDITGAGIRFFPLQMRYAWPSELDLMAQLAGLRLRGRWGGWARQPFTAGSARHVSVYEHRPA